MKIAGAGGGETGMLMASERVDLLGAFRRHRADKGDEPYLIDRGTRSYTWREGVDMIEAKLRIHDFL